MSENITDISKWKEKYPFLFNAWFTYEQFEKNLDDDANRNSYYSLCFGILRHLGESVDKYKSGCMKLMRNLKFYAPYTSHFKPTNEGCDILYNWLKKLISDNEINENIINKCFDDYDEAKRSMNDNTKCSYESNNQDFINPMYIIFLNIFHYNTKDIKNTLTGDNAQHRIICQNFVCEAVKIYKYMYETHCHNKKLDSEKLRNTCLKLSNFKGSYDFFYNDLGSFNYNIPSLNNIDNEISTKCSPTEKRTLSALGGADIPAYTLDNEMTTTDENSDYSLQRGFPASPDVAGYSSGVDLSTPYGNEDSSMKKSITTTIGTVAGASSLLAFLYKFTPAGRLVNPRLRRIGIRTNNNFYSDGESELLYDEFAHGDMNSYNIGYEAA